MNIITNKLDINMHIILGIILIDKSFINILLVIYSFEITSNIPIIIENTCLLTLNIVLVVSNINTYP